MTEWKTEISSTGKDAKVRGEDLEKVMEMDFSDAIFLILKGERPDEKESEIFKTILSSCIDHGVGNPSTVAARTVQSGGNDMNTSVAAGIMALGDKHGGAIEEAMELIQSEDPAKKIIEEKLRKEEKIPGLGHKVYTDEDPRSTKILEKAEDLGLKAEYTEKILEIQRKFGDEKTELVLNVDGAIAGIMSDLGFEPELGKGFFIIARTPGLVAHVREEMDEKDFRHEDGKYTGDK